MPTRPPSPDPTGATQADQGSNPFASMGAGLGAGLGFFQDWLKAAGSALPNMPGAASGSASGMPAWSMPTLDPEELEKRIQDLKTVQFWLEQNARMIAMTIQGLEVQRMTLSTLKGMNVSMDALRESLKVRPGAEAASAPPPTSAPPARPFSASRQDESTAGSDDAPSDAGKAASGEAAADGAELINPMRWWDTLTQQFSHLASQAAQTVGDSVGESMDMIKQAQATAADFSAPAAGKKAGTSTSKPATSAKRTAGKTAARKTTRSASNKP